MHARHTLVAGMCAVLFCTFLPIQSQAANGLDGFDPANLIADEHMYGDVADSMTEEEISAFLREKGASCAKGKDGSPCLKDATFNTQTFPVSQWCSGEFAGSSTDSAAAVISKAAKACRISPKVLIVLLQKEQGLITTTNPTARAYTRATGFACPDTAPCDPSKAGFATQVYAAASRLQQYKAQPHRFTFAVGRTSKIGYHPNAGCGSTTVTPTTAATAALYNYTPYVPNAAALANPYGAGDSCSAYGNRNFYRIHKDWFGQPNMGQESQGENSQPTPTPTPQTPAPTPTPTPRNEILSKASLNLREDLTGDGAVDILTPQGGLAPNGFGWGNGTTMEVAQLSERPTVSNSPARTIGRGWDASKTIDAGDWNGDGLSDLMLVRNNGELWLYPGRPNISWGNPYKIGHGWGIMDKVLGGADFDEDGRVDLLARNARTGTLHLYRGNGRGSFLDTKTVGVGWSGFSALALIPSWKDGHTAVAAVSRANGRLHIYPTLGKGRWGSRYDLGYGWKVFSSLAGTRDVTGDGRGDLLTVQADGTLRTYATSGNTFVALPASQSALQARAIFAGGSVYQNYRYIIDASGALYAYDVRPQKNTTYAQRISTGIRTGSDEKLLNVGDWDGNGFPDIIKWNSANELIFHRGIAANRWDTTGTRIGWGWDFTDVIVANAWAKSGENGLLAWNKRDGSLRLYTSRAPGVWTNVFTIGQGLTWADHIASAGNWSSEGGPQLLVREEYTGRLMWIGSDSYNLRVAQPRHIGQGWGAIVSFQAIADGNGDSKTDILSLRRDGKVMLYTGLGNYRFGAVDERYAR